MENIVNWIRTILGYIFSYIVRIGLLVLVIWGIWYVAQYIGII